MSTSMLDRFFNRQPNVNTAAPNTNTPNGNAMRNAAQNQTIPPGSTVLEKQIQNNSSNSSTGNQQSQTANPANNPNNADTVTQNNNQSPLDAFKTIWDAPTNSTQPEPLFKPDQAKLKDAVSKMNFADGIDPGLVQKALGGDQASFLQVINSVGQQSFMHALTANSQMVEGAFTRKMPELEKNFDTRYKNNRTTELFAADNPAFNHPSVKPLFDSIRHQVRSKFPDASPEEAAQMTREYFGTVAKLFGETGDLDEEESRNVSAKAGSKSQDWGAFFS